MSVSVVARMLRDYPTLLPAPSFFHPQSQSKLVPAGSLSRHYHYHGYITIGDTQHRIELLTAPNIHRTLLHAGLTPVTLTSSQHGTVRIGCESALQQLVAAEASTLQRRWHQSEDLHAFLDSFIDTIQSALAREPAQSVGSSAAERTVWLTKSFYSAVISELSAIGWSNVATIDNDGQCVTLHCRDQGRRRHQLVAELPPNYPSHAPTFHVTLPVLVEWQWNSDVRSLPPSASSSNTVTVRNLADAYRQWVKMIESLQSYYDVMTDFDRHCIVLEPEPPQLSLPHRRIGMAASVSAHIEIDPHQPTHMPVVRWLGPETHTEALRKSLSANAVRWDPSLLPRLNLERLLSTSLPKPKSLSLTATELEAALNMECAICYSFSLNGAAPTIVCANARCSRCYHPPCLHSWLQNDIGTAVVFDRCIGKCINCHEPISVQVQR